VPKELKQEHISEKQIDIQAYKQQLEALMLQQKPYLEAQLTLPELALQMKISLHLLSKVINDGYDKNFHDFVNTYRIEEFKNLIVKPQYKHQTILAAALDAGFNSKTAFNRAFKKITNSTPREFLKQQSLGEMKEE
jgi:AraC-like DNA-binding protein